MSVSRVKLLGGRVVLPVAVRKALGLREGDTVVFEVVQDGSVQLTAERKDDPFSEYAGALRQGRGKPLDAIIRELREERGDDFLT